MPPTLADKINALKKKRNAVILVHSYQSPEVQEIADLLGDSLDLSMAAAKTKADCIVFCGVHFMAETAHLLAPGKTVLLPDMAAGCPMADMVSVESLRALKARHPSAAVVCYVNTTAAVKAESDICCTSANAVQIVSGLAAREIIFVPDRNLGRFVAGKCDKKIILAPGYCHVHMRMLPEHIEAARAAYPGAEVLVHPECSRSVVDIADKVFSTTGMCAYARASSGKDFIIGTETGIINRLKNDNPGKRFYPALEIAVCHNMKKITPEKVLAALEEMKHVITVPEPIASKAKKAIEAMLPA